MDKIDKALLKLSDKQRQKLLEAFHLVVVGQTKGLDIKKLKGQSNFYRLRIGNTRLVYKITSEEPIIIFVGKRDDQTYRDF